MSLLSTPEKQSKLRKYSKKEIVGASIAGAALLAGGIAVGRQTAPTGLTKAEVSAIALETASKESAASETAQSYGISLSDRFNKLAFENAPLKIAVNVLNGTITEQAKTGDYLPSYKNAILLATATNVQPDANGDFLNGAWFGVVGHDETGNMVITPVAYDPSSMKFSQNHQNIHPDLAVIGVGVGITGPDHGGPGDLVPYGIDLQNIIDPLKNDDGSDFLLGQGVGMK